MNEVLKTVENIIKLIVAKKQFSRESALRVFDSLNVFTALVAQLDRASDFESEGWGFKSLRVYKTIASQFPLFRDMYFALFKR
jgi:hypothetical protein